MTGILKLRSKSTAKLLARKINKSKYFSKEFDKGLEDWIKTVSNNKYFGKQIRKVLGKIKAGDIKLVVLSLICGTIFTFVGYVSLIILAIKLFKLVFFKGL